MLKNNFYNDSKGRSYFTPRLLLKFVCIISFFRFNQYMVLKMKKKKLFSKAYIFSKIQNRNKKKTNKQTNMHFKYLTIWWYDNCLIESYVYFWCLPTIFESRQFFDAKFYIQWERKSFVYFFFFYVSSNLFVCWSPLLYFEYFVFHICVYNRGSWLHLAPHVL